jgi:hypothetical protein
MNPTYGQAVHISPNAESTFVLYYFITQRKRSL